MFWLDILDGVEKREKFKIEDLIFLGIYLIIEIEEIELNVYVRVWGLGMFIKEIRCRVNGKG